MPQHNWDPEAAAVFADMDAEELFGADPTLYDAHRWARFPYWTSDEATALSFNKNPDIVQAAFLKDLPHEFAEIYSDRMTLLERAVAKGRLSDKASPAEIVSWMNETGLDISNDLFDALRDKTPLEVVPGTPLNVAPRTPLEVALEAAPATPLEVALEVAPATPLEVALEVAPATPLEFALEVAPATPPEVAPGTHVDVALEVDPSTPLEVAPTRRPADITKEEQTHARALLSLAVLHYGFKMPTPDCDANKMARKAAAKMVAVFPIKLSTNTLCDKLKKAYDNHGHEIDWTKFVN